MSGHPTDMEAAPARQMDTETECRPEAPILRETKPKELCFGDMYEEYFDFIWRSARRLGVAESNLDDAVQDVFLTAHRKLGEFEGRSSIKTWLFGILLLTVRGYRRTAQRKPVYALTTENIADQNQSGPLEFTARTEAVEQLYRLLDSLDDEKREVFVQAELAQMTAQEIAEVMGVNINTVYSRLRAARRAFEEAVTRFRARDRWRSR